MVLRINETRKQSLKSVLKPLGESQCLRRAKSPLRLKKLSLDFDLRGSRSIFVTTNQGNADGDAKSDYHQCQ